MKKEGSGKYLLPAVAVGASLFAVEVVREVSSLHQVAYNPTLRECIDNRYAYGFEPYSSARRECIAEAGLHAESTPVLDFVSFATGHREN